MVIFIVKLLILTILLVFSFNNMNVSDIDYEDIYNNIDDYEYSYNYINREGV
jgi:regulatory protein YycI of two-component signal transduction system YycFG